MTRILKYVLLGALVITVFAPSYGAAVSSESESHLAGYRISKIITNEILRRNPAYKKGVDISVPWRVLQDRTTAFWIATPIDLYIYSAEADKWTNLSAGPHQLMSVENILQDDTGTIWLRSIGGSILRNTDGIWQEPEELAKYGGSKAVRFIFGGQAGAIWFIQKDALAYKQGDRWEQISIPTSISESYASFPNRYYDKYSEITVRGEEKLEMWKRMGKQAAEIPVTPLGERLTSGLQDRDGNVWLCCRNALIRFNKLDRSWKIFPVPKEMINATRIYEDKRGRLWVADTFGHIAIYNKVDDSWVNINIQRFGASRMSATMTVNSIYETIKGIMLIGTSEGLLTWREAADEWRIYTESNSALPGSYISFIYEDRKRNIWISARGIVVLEQ